MLSASSGRAGMPPAGETADGRADDVIVMMTHVMMMAGVIPAVEGHAASCSAGRRDPLQQRGGQSPTAAASAAARGKATCSRS